MTGGGAIVSAARGKLPRFSLVHLRSYVGTGALAIAIPIPLLTYVAPNLPAGVVTLVIILSPPLTYVFATLLGMEKPHWLRIVGTLLGLGGVLIVILPKTSLPSPDMAGWVVLALGAPLCFAMTNVFAARFRPPESLSVTLASGLLLAAAVLLVPVMLGTGQLYLFPGPSFEADLALLLVTLVNALHYFLFLDIIRLAGPVFFAQFNYLAVIAGIGWGLAIVGERHSIYVWGALAVMLLGLTLVNYGGRMARGASAPP